MTCFTWALLSALFAAITALLAKVGIQGVDANLATAIRTSAVMALSWGIVGATRTATPAIITRETWLFLIGSGIATGLSWLCYFHALQSGPVSRVAPTDKLSVVLTIAFSAILLGESFTPRALRGAAFIVAGVFLIALE